MNRIALGLLIAFLSAPFAMAQDAPAGKPHGTLNPASGGYPADIWAGSDGHQIEKFLTLLPETVLSPATHELLRRTLLTQAHAPANVPEDEFVRARVIALLKIGSPTDAGALLRTLSPAEATEGTSRQVVDGEFSAGQTEEACLDVRSDAAQFSGGYWKRAMVVCELQAGQKDQAASDIAALVSDPEDPGFAEMAKAVSQGQASSSAGDLTPVDFALLRVGHAAEPASILKNDDVLVLAGIARTDTFGASTRVEAGYASAVQGGINAGEMLALFRLPGAASAAPGDATIAKDDPTQSMAENAHADAAVIQQIDASRDSAERVTLLKKLLTQDSDSVDEPYIARVEFLKQVSMTTDRSALAPAASRGLFLEGDLSAAQRWYGIAQQAGNSLPVWPLAHIAFDDLGSASSADALQRWVEQTISADKDNGPKRAERVLAAVSALGEAVPPSLWGETVGKPDDDASIMGSMAVSAAMAEAASRGSRGEVVVLAALSLKDGPAHAHPMNLNHAVGSLWHVGMRNQAKALALEGLAPATEIGKSQ
jgi:hypothetical protein